MFLYINMMYKLWQNIFIFPWFWVTSRNDPVMLRDTPGSVPGVGHSWEYSGIKLRWAESRESILTSAYENIM